MKHEFQVDKEREKRLMAMGQMAASLAHEIRNPLGSMELFCSLLKKDLAEQPGLFGLAEQIHSGIRTVNHIITNCLQFAREIVANRKPVTNIREYLEKAIENIKAKATESGVEVEIVTIGEGSISIDHYQMKQVIINLVSNAIDAVAERFHQLPDLVEQKRVIIESDLGDDAFWILSINDNGIGISEESKKSIFEPFFSTKTLKKR